MSTYCFRNDDLELVCLLLRIGAKVNYSCGTLQMRPLHMAVYNHNIDMMTLLLEADANAKTDVLDKWNYSPLMYAAIHYDAYAVSQMFRLLLSHGASPNYGATLSHDSREAEVTCVNTELPLLYSTYSSDNITYVRVPLGPTSGTALHLVVQNPHVPNEVLDLLLSAEADVNKLNLYGQTPLMCAVQDIYFDYHSSVKAHTELLLSRQAAVDIQDMRGWTALHYAAQRGSISCMSLLMASDCDCDLKSKKQESALWLLLALGWREACTYLLCSGCDMNQPIFSSTLLTINQNIELCRYGNIYPVEFAVCNRFYELAEVMVDVGAIVNANMWLGNYGDPLLHRTKKRQELQTLLDSCRTVIRQSLRRNICAKMKNILLPQMLKDFICHMPLNSLQM